VERRPPSLDKRHSPSIDERHRPSLDGWRPPPSTNGDKQPLSFDKQCPPSLNKLHPSSMNGPCPPSLDRRRLDEWSPPPINEWPHSIDGRTPLGIPMTFLSSQGCTAVSIDTCTALARFIGHFWWANPCAGWSTRGFS
jgi:hypothetical protein